MTAHSLLYEKMTWPEIDAAPQAGKPALLPVATIEDHGPHLPVDTDVVIVSAVGRAPGEPLRLCLVVGADHRRPRTEGADGAQPRPAPDGTKAVSDDR